MAQGYRAAFLALTALTALSGPAAAAETAEDETTQVETAQAETTTGETQAPASEAELAAMGELEGVRMMDTISITAQTEEAVVQAIARHMRPPISTG